MSELDYWLKKIDDRLFNLEVTIILTGDVKSKKKLIKLMNKEIEKKNEILETKRKMEKNNLIRFYILVVILIVMLIGISFWIWYYFPLIKNILT